MASPSGYSMTAPSTAALGTRNSHQLPSGPVKAPRRRRRTSLVITVALEEVGGLIGGGIQCLLHRQFAGDGLQNAACDELADRVELRQRRRREAGLVRGERRR